MENFYELKYLNNKEPLAITYGGYYIQRGDKFGTPENSKASCEELAEELRLHGYQCRVGYNEEADIWSVAVL